MLRPEVPLTPRGAAPKGRADYPPEVRLPRHLDPNWVRLAGGGWIWVGEFAEPAEEKEPQ